MSVQAILWNQNGKAVTLKIKVDSLMWFFNISVINSVFKIPNILYSNSQIPEIFTYIYIYIFIEKT